MTTPTAGGTDHADAMLDGDAVRRAVRDWIDRHFDRDLSLRAWLERLADSGWAKPTWPVAWFGKGLPTDLAAIAYVELAKAGAPGPPAGLGPMLAAPTIIAHASDDLKRRLVRAILVGDHAWCQLFSEPGAGSDLAGLQARAERHGDEFVVNGQKVWTSGAQIADYGMLLARTDPDAPKHRGITYFALEMQQPGIEIRPLRQITGESSFAEVFMTDVRVPVRNVIGETNQGWKVAVATLGYERLGLGAGSGIDARVPAPGGSRFRSQLEVSVGDFIDATKTRRTWVGTGGAAMLGRGVAPLVELARRLGRDRDAGVRQQLVRLHTLTRVNAWNGLRGRASVQAGGKAGGETSIGKLMGSHIARQWRETASEIGGAHGMLAGQDGPLEGAVAVQMLATPGPAIYGGTDQIQRTIIGERVLGLPAEPDVSREVPFRQLKVGTQSREGSSTR
jgi:alkylation response protein AidB-like acyl-CoA dehydrogenase